MLLNDIDHFMISLWTTLSYSKFVLSLCELFLVCLMSSTETAFEESMIPWGAASHSKVLVECWNLKWLAYAHLFCMDNSDQIGHYHCDDDWCTVCVFHYHISSSMAALPLFHFHTLATQFAQRLLSHVCFQPSKPVLFVNFMSWYSDIRYMKQHNQDLKPRFQQNKSTRIYSWTNCGSRTSIEPKSWHNHIYHIIKTIFLYPFQAHLVFKKVGLQATGA